MWGSRCRWRFAGRGALHEDTKDRVDVHMMLNYSQFSCFTPSSTRWRVQNASVGADGEHEPGPQHTPRPTSSCLIQDLRSFKVSIEPSIERERGLLIGRQHEVTVCRFAGSLGHRWDV